MLRVVAMAALIFCGSVLSAHDSKPEFRVIAFFTGKEDPAHLSFLREAEQWFPQMAAKHHFRYDTTSNWRRWSF